MKTVQGKPIKGYSYADGIHWHWGDTEVAVIDQSTGEIEWCERKSRFPDEVIQTIRDLRPRALARWIIEVKQIDYSATQHGFDVLINGERVANFGDGVSIGEVVFSDDPKLKENPGKYVYATFWHPHDDIYHVSDKAKDIFMPDWRVK